MSGPDIAAILGLTALFLLGLGALLWAIVALGRVISTTINSGRKD